MPLRNSNQAFSIFRKNAKVHHIVAEMKTRKFLFILLSIALVLGALIYWREYSSREQVNIFSVILWQLVIWTPWIGGFFVLKKIHQKKARTSVGRLLPFLIGLLLIVAHFGWFFVVSNNFSPYLDFEGSRFGVYRYFFIFWTLIDMALVWYIIDTLGNLKNEHLVLPRLVELTRGNKKFYLEPNQIHLLVSENYYTKLFTSQGPFIVRKPLKDFHKELPSQLFRKIHRSTIINVQQVSELTRGTGTSLEVIMKDGTRKRVSKSYIKDITDFFKERSY